MTKHFFVTGVMALGLAMLAGAHASATARIDDQPAFGKAQNAAAAITLARRSGTAASDDTNANDRHGDKTKPDDNNNNRQRGKKASVDASDEGIVVARRGNGTEIENENEQGGHNHRQRRGGRNTAA